MFVSGVDLVGTNPGEFDIFSESCTESPVLLLATCEVKLTFKPSVTGARNAELQVTYNGSPSPLSVPLTGTGTRARISKVSVSGPATLRKGKSATFKARITNSGDAAATGVRLIVSGKGIRLNARVGRIGAGATRTFRLRIRASRPGRIKSTFKVVSGNAGSKSVKKTIRVRR